MLGLAENGRISNRAPDYIGTWDVSEPSKGYFEMFVDQQHNGSVIGTIKDCLGTAAFAGVTTPQSFDFTKHYTESAESAVDAHIVYEGKRPGTRKEFYGYFYVRGFGTAFYMSSAQRSPVQMSLRWFELKQREKQ